MITVEMTLINGSGLHARPASYIVNALKSFKAEVEIANGEKRCNAKSLTGLLTLGARHGSKLMVTANGIDEDKAIVELRNIVESHID